MPFSSKKSQEVTILSKSGLAVSHTQPLCKNNHPTGEKSGQKVPSITLMVMLRSSIDSTGSHQLNQMVHKRNTHGPSMRMLSALVIPSKLPKRLLLLNSELQRMVDSI